MIAQHKDTRFGLKGHQLFILFDSEDTHCGDGLWSAFLTKHPVFSQSYFPEGAQVLNTAFFPIITLELDLAIGVG